MTAACVVHCWGADRVLALAPPAGRSMVQAEGRLRVPGEGLPGKERGVGVKRLTLLPPKPGLCQECGVSHEAGDPHDVDSLYYQFKFNALHGRRPTWKDALEGCSAEVQRSWEEVLREEGVWTEPETRTTASGNDELMTRAIRETGRTK